MKTVDSQDSALTEQAKKALRQQTDTPESLFELGSRLQNGELFDYARRVFALARQASIPDEELRRSLAYGQAVCTSRDPDLPAMDRLDDALAILQETEDLQSTRDQRALVIAGSIYRQKWQVEGQKQHAETSFEYYDRGHQQGVNLRDQGLSGINAAFLLDLLGDIEARQARTTGSSMVRAEQFRRRAKVLREQLVKELTRLNEENPIQDLERNWKFVMALAEAFFGLQQYDRAREWLDKGRKIEAPGWQVQAAALQLARIAQLQNPAEGNRVQHLESTDPWTVLQDFLGQSEMAMRSTFLGRVGVALSGGGFRASFFHIGVLAKLAEHDILRHVEVLSCVSGGSILGAYYYLELRHLLRAVPDAEIKTEHYIDIVERMCRNFLAGVQTNIRVQIVSNLWLNLKMALAPGYSRTHRVGELYEKRLYSRVGDNNRDEPRYINRLAIHPLNEPEDFRPGLDNWRRQAKAPLLVVNATTLNTGHQWQFTTSFMGEPAASINTAVDGNSRLRRMAYTEAPDGYRDIRLGYAVGASSCVPGVLEPLEFRGLYPDLTVSLVDGGVYDNQGTASLLEQNCDNVIVSDASGQMGDEDAPAPGVFSVISRTNTVLQARLRDAMDRTLDARTRFSLLRSIYVHLKQDLDVIPKDWSGCDDPKEISARSLLSQFTSYDIRKDVQQMLAGVRTDLDSFSDAEAFALMTSGYRMMGRQLEINNSGFARHGSPHPWKFLEVEERMRRAEPKDRLIRILKVSGQSALKVWSLIPMLALLSYAVVAGGIVAAISLFVYFEEYSPISLSTAIGASVLIGSGLAASGFAMRFLGIRNNALKIVIGIAGSFALWLAANVHLAVFDKLYLKYGSSESLRK